MFFNFDLGTDEAVWRLKITKEDCSEDFPSTIFGDMTFLYNPVLNISFFAELPASRNSRSSRKESRKDVKKEIRRMKKRKRKKMKSKQQQKVLSSFCVYS